ncbi:hypothetical protein SAMN05443662_1216 [Sulfurivirga caldicuralii]|uniref:Uncharacterized protein n=1 Tax=Sulfurivirga caldicuralii TaxID=364032 RepID=A0A1N6G719_9GAMM|nr:YeeE/YedE thiosulfate transporter family protein [Sulfurivirga caldicuralii]SIO03212.1 hypothetical protein SAMN05443662_1216 [Sulfurivirga caldicuralii]
MYPKGEWDWLKGGLAMVAVAIAAFLLVKPLGVSTQFAVVDTMIWKTIDPEIVQKKEVNGKEVLTSPNAYINKSHAAYARAAENPLNYGLIFVLAMIGGAFLSVLTGGPKPSKEERRVPEGFQRYFGHKPWLRYALAFVGGIVTLYGARLAGGCTSGHMISGISQTAVSSLLFAAGVFITAIPTAIWLYRKRGGNNQ